MKPIRVALILILLIVSFVSRTAFSQSADDRLITIAAGESIEVNIPKATLIVVLNQSIALGRVMPSGLTKITGLAIGETQAYVWIGRRRVSYQINVIRLETPFIREPSDNLRPDFGFVSTSYNAYRIEVDWDYVEDNGAWLAPIYTHNLHLNRNFSNGSSVSADVQALQDPRRFDTNPAYPLSGDTRVTSALLQYNSRRVRFALGDVGARLTDITVGGFPLRGGELAFIGEDPREGIAFLGGFARPSFEDAYFDADTERMYQIFGTKRIEREAYLTGRFAFFDETDAVTSAGLTKENDFVGSLYLDWTEVFEDFDLEAEFSRSRHDFAFGGRLNYHRYWGEFRTFFRRIGPNFFEPIRGSLLRDFQEVLFDFVTAPYPWLEILTSVIYNENDLANSLAIPRQRNVGGNLGLNYRLGGTRLLFTNYSITKGFEEQGGFLAQQALVQYSQSFVRDDRFNTRFTYDRRHGDGPLSRFTKADSFGLSTNYDRPFDENWSLLAGQDFRYDINRAGVGGGGFTDVRVTNLNFFVGGAYNARRLSAQWQVNAGITRGGGFSGETYQIFQGLIYRPVDAYEFFFNATFSHQRLATGGINSANFRSGMTIFFGGGVQKRAFQLKKGKGSIRGAVFVDANQNGFFDTDEKGWPDIDVTLSTGETTKTDKGGHFNFGKREPGTYEITIDTKDIVDQYKLTTANPLTVHLKPREEYVANFGLSNYGLITGRIYDDVNYNDKLDAIDVGVIGVRVTVEGEGKKYTAVSDNDGYYRVYSIAPGDYEVSIDPSTAPANYELIGQPTERLHIKARGQGKADFRFRALRSVYGFVYWDKNLNSRHDSDEPKLSGIPLRIGNKRTRTGAQGKYFVKKVPGGQISLELAVPGYRGFRLEPLLINLGTTPIDLEQNIPLVK